MGHVSALNSIVTYSRHAWSPDRKLWIKTQTQIDKEKNQEEKEKKAQEKKKQKMGFIFKV